MPSRQEGVREALFTEWRDVDSSKKHGALAAETGCSRDYV
jgi:hypothetical protein